jgi:hypothetical protein
MGGEIKQMDLQLQKYNEQLKTEFKDAHEKYRRQHIKVKVHAILSPAKLDYRRSDGRFSKVCEGIGQCDYEVPQHEDGRDKSNYWRTLAQYLRWHRQDIGCRC